MRPDLLSPQTDRFRLAGSQKGKCGLGSVISELCSFLIVKVSEIQTLTLFEPVTPLIALGPFPEKRICTQSFVLKSLSPLFHYPQLVPESSL